MTAFGETCEVSSIDESFRNSSNDSIYENETEEEMKKGFKQLQRETDAMFDAILDDPVERDKLFPDDDESRELKIGPYEEILDPGTGKWSCAKDIKAFYGKEILARMKRELENNLWEKSGRQLSEYSKQLYHEMKCMRAGTKPKKINEKQLQQKSKVESTIKANAVKNSKVEQRKKKPGDEYYLRTHRGVIKNRDYRKIFKGPEIIYQWLWANIARNGWNDTPDYPLKKNFYDKGLLACTMSFRTIAEECGINKNTVKKHIDTFQEAGIIKIKHWVPKGKKRGQNIYILGKWTKDKGKPRETYYRDEVFLSD